ncbi:hypothetical protein E4U43_004060 [Claviceps pusilla]|uniref:Hsp70 protein n=1 Tax=Claviceps pusilla TaxID=123648 RepID=A0A9P7NHC3_9HYPO|nr:hypothetical protein E4U43_004060 [Claviceps pusilla]
MASQSGRFCAVVETEEKLIIALDFGTTYSGVAFCFANQTDAKPIAIMNWPGNHGISAPKIPTIIEYTREATKGFRWGASVDKLNGGIIAIKLLLDPDQERPLYLPSKNIKKELQSLPKKPFEIAADFIGAIYEHALEEISKTVPKAYMDMCDKEFVLSVPAVWSDAAKNATLKAAELAGIEPVTVVKEPEAAALYSIKTLDFSIKKNDAFVVCDAGGGTVDLISYEVMATMPQLKVKELVPGTGGMAGSLGLNQRFAAAVEDLVGDLQWLKLKTSRAWSFAEKQFDQEIKTAFRGEMDEEYFVNFPMADLWDDPDSGLKQSTWRLTGRDLTKIFEPLVADILRMIEHQVQEVQLKRTNKDISGIFLVGGFGSSRYLMQRVAQHFPKIQVLQPSDAWAAIVKGSALSKLPGQAAVTSTCATRHYGTRVGSVYEESRDRGEITYRDRQGITRVTTMGWFILTGDDILRDQRIKITLNCDFDNIRGSSDLLFTYGLWQSEDKIAPVHPSKANKLKRNCNVTGNLRNVPKHKFKPRVDTDGISYHAIDIDFIVTLQSAVMTFSMEIDGEEIGSAERELSIVTKSGDILTGKIRSFGSHYIHSLLETFVVGD